MGSSEFELTAVRP